MAWAQDFQVVWQFQLLQVLHNKVLALALLAAFVIELFQLPIPPVLPAAGRVGHAATTTTGLTLVRVKLEVLATRELTTKKDHFLQD